MQKAKRKMQNEKLKQIRQAKHAEYGSFSENMNNIGRAWSSLLGLKKNLPGHVVANMYVIAKLIRTQGGFKQDTYDDAANYLCQAEAMQKLSEVDYKIDKAFFADRLTPTEIAKRLDEAEEEYQRSKGDSN